jgi:hypothetical protein
MMFCVHTCVTQIVIVSFLDFSTFTYILNKQKEQKQTNNVSLFFIFILPLRELRIRVNIVKNEKQTFRAESKELMPIAHLSDHLEL